MKFGFIGFGEVGQVFSRALREKGGEILIYDILLDHPLRAPLLQERIRQAGAVAGSLSEVVSRSDYLFSVVTTEVAKAAAELCSEHLKPGQFYVDLNSTSPTVKVNIGRIIEDRGADF
ncbi:MAG: NAD(P)-dependent oxidoreductase, partial [Acidobacteria bacterium]